MLFNAFCATGEGGGIDNSCSSGSITDGIEESISEVTKEWNLSKSVKEHGDVRKACNEGMCDAVADKIVSKFPGAKYREGTSGDDSGHAWVEYKGKHYDAEKPEGVDHPRDLPYFSRHGGFSENE